MINETYSTKNEEIEYALEAGNDEAAVFFPIDIDTAKLALSIAQKFCNQEHATIIPLIDKDTDKVELFYEGRD
jgi:dihydroxyacetone kinase DhaKLM complex PTS-EIIA-like component DhaM